MIGIGPDQRHGAPDGQEGAQEEQERVVPGPVVEGHQPCVLRCPPFEESWRDAVQYRLCQDSADAGSVRGLVVQDTEQGIR